jgi:alkylation response protein AidB-like acyl-CoA dehydrogenase
LDFAWSDEQLAFRKSVIQFAQKELNYDVIEADRAEEFSWEGWKKCAGFGIHGLPVPEEYGGSGADILTTVVGMEALGYGCKDNGLIFSINAHMWTSEIPLLTFGTAEQKQRFLPRLSSGEIVGAHAITEPSSGSDAYSLKTRAERRGNCYVLNGSKTFITNAENADVITVFANVDPSRGAAGITGFIIERGTPGLSVSRRLEKMGLRTSPTCEVTLTDCTVPASSILGKEGSGPAIFTASMEWERICIMASKLGAMQRLLETSVKYANERRQFGEPIGKFSAVSDRIAEMDCRLEASRLLLYKAAWLKKNGKHPLREAAIAKLFVAEAFVQSALDAVKVHGGYGYMTEYQIERELRDAVAGTIYSGTSDIQRKIIAGFHGL